MKESVLAIIPARGGSKRLPRKNVKELQGKPLIAWTVEAALMAETITDVIVSTDDDEIAAIALKYGAMVPFLRPACLASDDATTESVVRHAVDFMRHRGRYDRVIILQPTSPLRTAIHIDEANKLFELKSANAVVSVTKCEHNPNWINQISSDLSLAGFLDTKFPKNEYCYRLNGAIYIIKESLCSDLGSLYREGSYAYIMDRDSSIDIDEENDFMYASFIMGVSNNVNYG